jgi:hypothetical protein
MRHVKLKTSDDLVPLGQAGMEDEEVKAQVETLCHSAAFERQGNAKKLLRYLVPQSLAGKNPTPREIALKGLGRKNYYPGDANVRNAADKLRKCLEKHYASAEAKPGEIRFYLPSETYIIHAPKSPDVNNQSPRYSKSRMVGVIVDPAEGAEVYHRLTVRGRIDALDADLRVWLVIEIPVGIYYPQCRVSRKSPEWESEVRIGFRLWGTDEGTEYVIHLVAADSDGDFHFYEYLKAARDGFGAVLPTDCLVLYSRRVTRCDLRPEAPTGSA